MKSRKTVLKAKKITNKTAKKLRKNKTLKKRILKKKRKTLKKAGALEDSKLNIISGNEDDEDRDDGRDAEDDAWLQDSLLQVHPQVSPPLREAMPSR